MDNNDAQERKPDPFWLTTKPQDRMCSAKTRSGMPCKKWAMRGRKRCRLHGGVAPGPTTPAITDGLHTLMVLKEKLLIQIEAAAKEEAGIVPFLSGWLDQIFPALDYREFRRIRPILLAFCRGDMSARKVVSEIEKNK